MNSGFLHVDVTISKLAVQVELLLKQRDAPNAQMG
eukprot:CAMPEP_0202904954 /NCGR_PEP_ID=MMETSP1392-20130828/31937_1 /ASSEMBLY_ACC=CAM_ASM_000868 /TAXON_ID=225041 /ORGANISM="Chlamydomonas chlamydogama, Strain SAG 11-48b" /LENGTH=34 /DNA_ID= /DNA_START= /DNA_END= /DNA_ORIENTATION=